MNEVAIWSLEEQFWMEAAIYYQSALDPECIMGFPAPVGIIVGKAILESLAQAPRWAAIEMGECGLVRPTPDLIALGYRARATRGRALPAGVARMPRGRFHLYTFLGSWPWCLGLAYLGMKLGENWRELGKYFHKFDAVIGVVLVTAVAWFVWSHWQNRIGRQTASEQ